MAQRERKGQPPTATPTDGEEGAGGEAAKKRPRRVRANAQHRPADETGAGGALDRMGAASAQPANEAQLTGMLLVAMPTMGDPRFERSVIYLCAHSAEGAMGIVVNQPAENVSFPGVVEQLGIDAAGGSETPVHVGGPVESSRGFVLHSPDLVLDSTLVIDREFALTATIDVLKAIAEGSGPQRRLLALGYAGWGAGQLDTEIQANGWLLAPADADLVFGGDNDGKWTRAMAKIGVDPRLLSTTAGHA